MGILPIFSIMCTLTTLILMVWGLMTLRRPEVQAALTQTP